MDKKKLKRHVKKHKDWQAYANKELDAGNKPIKFTDYEQEPVYYGKVSKPTVESQLKAAGLSGKDISKLKRKIK